MKSLKLQDISEHLKAQLVGDKAELISGINGILEAGKGEITFLANNKYQHMLPACQASAVIVSPDVNAEGINLVKIENPRLAFARIVDLMMDKKEESKEISEHAFISPTATIGEGCTIYPNVFIGSNTKIGKNTTVYPGTFIGDDVSIGDDGIIYANVSIHHNSLIGDRVILSPGSVIGSEGFGFERDGDRHYKIQQVGIVILEDDVEIGALCAIDRGSVKSTIIKKGTKLDNLVHIAHNCELGENNLLASQTALAGTVKTGHNVYFSGRAGVMDHTKIIDRAQIGPASIVVKDIEEVGRYFGYPARHYPEWTKASIMFYKTDDLRKRVHSLEKRLDELTNGTE